MNEILLIGLHVVTATSMIAVVAPARFFGERAINKMAGMAPQLARWSVITEALSADDTESEEAPVSKDVARVMLRVRETSLIDEVTMRDLERFIADEKRVAT